MTSGANFGPRPIYSRPAWDNFPTGSHQAQDSSYHGQPSAVNPQMAQFYSAPTAPPPNAPGNYQGGYYGQPPEGPSNQRPEKNKHTKRNVFLTVGATAASVVVAGGVVMGIGGAKEQGGFGPVGGGDSKSAASELLANPPGPAECESLPGEKFTMAGTYQDVKTYGFDELFEINMNSPEYGVLRDGDGVTPITNVDPAKYDIAKKSYEVALEAMQFKPGEDTLGNGLGTPISMASLGLKRFSSGGSGSGENNPSDGVLGENEYICVDPSDPLLK